MRDVEDPWTVRGGIKQRRRELSKPMKIFLFAMLLEIAVILVTVALLYSRQSKKANKPNSELEKLADYYGKSLDQNSQPCDDFYAFACANLRKEYGKENEDRFDTMAVMKKRTRLSLDDFLTKPVTISDSATLREIKIFHQMCVNTTKVEAEGIVPVLALLNEIGGWPLLSNDRDDNQSWEEVVGSVNRAGFATFFPFDLEYDSHPNNSFEMIMVLTPILNLQRTRALPNEKRTMDYVKLVASLLNATNDRIDDDIEDFMDFESELYEITNSVVEYDKIHTLESLTITYPKIAWKTLFRNAFVSTGIKVSSNETVLLCHLEYSLKMSELLKKTSAKIIRNYVVWQLIEKAIPVMPERFREAKNAFEQRSIGQSRNLDCVKTLIDNAKVSMGHLYIKNHLNKLAKNKSHDMITSIESQAYRFLKNIRWMDKDANTRIIETLRNLKIMVPHPDDSIDVMETLDFRSNDTTFANYRRLAESHRNLKYSRLRMSQKDNQQFIPFDYATSTDAVYFPSMNASYMLAAIFQRPFFSVDQPMYLNYGGIGFVIAHEMTHGLKILSAYKNDRFRERIKCAVKLYGSYVLKQLNETVDGTTTVGENIGDLIGLKLSYRAYEELVKDSEEPLLPGLKYTARQWFWINAATTLCSYETDAALRNEIANDEHSPSEARVNVALANSDEFSRDFACPIGSRMNPARKCEFERARPAFHFDVSHLDEL